MSNYGFVYILVNESMPGAVKIGCTERSPFGRAVELSRPTGVPSPFGVLCFAEFFNFQGIEREVHRWCDEHRVSADREFFRRECLPLAVAMLWHHPRRLSFTDATQQRGQRPTETPLTRLVCKVNEFHFVDLPNPFATQPSPPLESVDGEGQS